MHCVLYTMHYAPCTMYCPHDRLSHHTGCRYSYYCTHTTALILLHSYYCTHTTVLILLHSYYCTHTTALILLHSYY
jgi:hypothetical protein